MTAMISSDRGGSGGERSPLLGAGRALVPPLARPALLGGGGGGARAGRSGGRGARRGRGRGVGGSAPLLLREERRRAGGWKGGEGKEGGEEAKISRRSARLTTSREN